MIVDDAGREWDTGANIAHRLGGGVTASMVRDWARHQGLTRRRITDDAGRPRVVYVVEEAAVINRDVQARGRGRGRRA
ncbi:MAG TPA: hypothetical protein VFX60_19105 [Micromonospora sp.]|nr:hypothetical protein [Micromonospora sp.]